MRKFVVLTLLIILAGCASTKYQKGQALADQGRYDQAIDTLYAAIKARPADAQAWRELGVAYYEKGDLIKAEDALKQSQAIAPHARTSLYIGLICEKQDDYAKAIDAYRAALSLKPSSRVGHLIRSHIDMLVAEKMKQDVSTALANESKIVVDTIPGNTVAVVDFDNSHLPPDLAPIAKGLAEFTAMDLAKVKTLRLVERQKIDMILGELKLSSSQYADPATSPRMGRLLGSRRIVTGSVLSTSGSDIRLDGAVVSIADSAAKLTGPTEGQVKRFFQIQKDFVFKVIDNLGITLTAAERDSIRQIPTESFLAFMAYCRGLDYQSRGMTDQARAEYKQALKEDGHFSQAATQTKALAAAAASGTSTVEQFESSAGKESEGGSTTGALDQFQGELLSDHGFIRDLNALDAFGNPSDSPPRKGVVDYNGVIIIRGSLDARP